MVIVVSFFLSHWFVPFNFFTLLFHYLTIHVAPLIIQLNNSIIFSFACIGLCIICDNQLSNFLDQMGRNQEVNFLVTMMYFYFFSITLYFWFLFLCVLFQLPFFFFGSLFFFFIYIFSFVIYIGPFLCFFWFVFYFFSLRVLFSCLYFFSACFYIF
jgi:hypothetical protein